VRVNSVSLIDEFGNLYDTHTLTSCNFPGDIFPHLGCVQYTTTRITGSQFVRCEVNVGGNGRTLRVNLVSLSSSVSIMGSSEGH
jgi:hypothetical protein